MKNIYVTGDKHGGFTSVLWTIKSGRVEKGDSIVVLGDAGVNYYEDERDVRLKKQLNESGVTFLLVRGNHDARPKGNRVFIDKDWVKGDFIVETDFPNILYMRDGEQYLLHEPGGHMASVLVIGGAYSVDKFHRLKMQSMGLKDFKWFEDEQLTGEEKARILKDVKGKRYDYVFTHTCPYRVRPVDMFLSFIDQSSVDESMEMFLQQVWESISFRQWYLGHWHTDRTNGIFRFLYNDIVPFGRVYE